jgi:hypothetical protein
MYNTYNRYVRSSGTGEGSMTWRKVYRGILEAAIHSSSQVFSTSHSNFRTLTPRHPRFGALGLIFLGFKSFLVMATISLLAPERVRDRQAARPRHQAPTNPRRHKRKWSSQIETRLQVSVKR